MNHITIDDRLDFAAQRGEYKTQLSLWSNAVKRLRRNGLVLTQLNTAPTHKGEHKYLISWEKATVEIPDGPFSLDLMIHELLEHQVPLSQGNMLWLMTEEVNRRQ